MKADVLPPERAAGINPLDVLHYARETGWTRVDGVRAPLAAYRHPGLHDADLVVPLESGYRDFGLRMSEVVTCLAEVEERPVLDILEDLLRGRADVIRYGIESADTADGMVPMDRALGVVEGARRSILAAACDVLKPQAFHPRLSRTEADQLVSRCRFGAEPGSFVVRVWCPIAAEDQPAATEQMSFEMPEAGESFARQVTRRLMRAMAHIVAAVQEDRLDRLVRPSLTDLPVSVNLLDALMEMQPEDPSGKLVVRATWARSTSEPADTPRRVEVKSELAGTLRKVADSLRPKPAERGMELLVGKIVELHREAESDVLSDGDVTLSFLDGEQVKRARLTLPADRYREACLAHADQRYASVRGILRHGSRVHRVESVSDFRVLE